jgi:hypothetical protein
VKSFLIRVGVFVGGLAAVSLLVSVVFERMVVSQTIVARQDRQWESVERPTRVLVCGDSHAWRAVDPRAFVGEDVCFNYASGGESYFQTYYKLKAVLDREEARHRPAVVLLPLEPHCFSTYREQYPINHAYWKRYLDYLDLGQRSREMARRGGQMVLSRLASYASSGSQFRALLTNAIRGRPGVRLTRGYSLDWKNLSRVPAEVVRQQARGRTRHQFAGRHHRDPLLIRYFEDCVEVCREHGCIPVLVAYPVTREYADARAALLDPAWSEAVEALLARHRSEPLHRLDAQDWFYGRRELFYDVDHLNSDGAQTFTKLLAAWLCEQGLGDVGRPGDEVAR